MKCEEVKPLLTQYLLGDLDKATAAEVRTHVEKCGVCQASLREIEPTLDLLRDALAAPSSAPKQLSKEVRRQIQGKVVSKRGKVVRWFVVSHPIFTRAAALLMIVFVFAGLLLPSIAPVRRAAYCKLAIQERRAAHATAASQTLDYKAEYGKYPATKDAKAAPAGDMEEVQPAEIQDVETAAGGQMYRNVEKRSYGGMAVGKGGAGKEVGASLATPAGADKRRPYNTFGPAPADPFGAVGDDRDQRAEVGQAQADPFAAATPAEPAASKAPGWREDKPKSEAKQVDLNDMIVRPKPTYVGTPVNLKGVNLDPAARKNGYFSAHGVAGNKAPESKEQNERFSVGRQGMVNGETAAGNGTAGKLLGGSQNQLRGEADTKATGGGGGGAEDRMWNATPNDAGGLLKAMKQNIDVNYSMSTGGQALQGTTAKDDGSKDEGFVAPLEKKTAPGLATTSGTRFYAARSVTMGKRAEIGAAAKPIRQPNDAIAKGNISEVKDLSKRSSEALQQGRAALATEAEKQDSLKRVDYDKSISDSSGAPVIGRLFAKGDEKKKAGSDSRQAAEFEALGSVSKEGEGIVAEVLSKTEAEVHEVMKSKELTLATKGFSWARESRDKISPTVVAATTEPTIARKLIERPAKSRPEATPEARESDGKELEQHRLAYKIEEAKKENLGNSGVVVKETSVIATVGPPDEFSSSDDGTGVGSGVGGVVDAPVSTRNPLIIKGMYGNRTKGAREVAKKSGDSNKEVLYRNLPAYQHPVGGKEEDTSDKDVEIKVVTSENKEKAREVKGEGKRGSQLSKLDSIVVPEIDFRQANIRDVVDFFKSSSEQFDKTADESKGVNIVLQLPPGSAAPAAAAGQQAGDELITFSARGLTIKQALKIVADSSGLKVTEEDNVIKLVPKDAPEDGNVIQSKKELEDKKEKEEEKTGPRFKAYGVNPFMSVKEQAFSTFGIDCDTASYTLARNYMLRGNLPPAEAVRTEEFVNFFDYAYRAPEQETFKVYVEMAPSKFGRGGLQMLKIGVKGRRLGREEQRRAVLTFLVDTSGSMQQPDRIGLAKKSLRMLVEKLNPQDMVSIVKYDSHAKLVIENVPASDKKKILDAIESLQCSGSTNLEEGMGKAYQIAARNFLSKGENRVLLLSDGVANLGSVAAKDILNNIEKYKKQGIFCSVFGLGMGTYNDEMLQELANKGDGTYKFIDSEAEARKVFVDDLAANLNTIAKNVKIQVEFNASRVSRYRQIGYERRQLKKEDFRNDTVDAGEVGSGQSVTALYETELKNEKSEYGIKRPERDVIATVRVRYQRVDNGQVEEIERKVTSTDMVNSFDKADVRFKLAACAAQFAEILRGSPFAEGREFQDVSKVLAPIALELNLDGRVQEFNKLVNGANGLSRGQ